MAKDNIKSAVSLTELPLEMLEAYRNTVVKSANQKARRLEVWVEQYNTKNPKHPSKVQKFAYARYSKENKRLYGGKGKEIMIEGEKELIYRGKEKLDLAGKLTTEAEKQKYANQLRHQIAAAEQFINAPTSSGKSYLDVGRRRLATIKELYGIDIELDDLWTFFDSPQYKRWQEKFGYDSKQALISIGNVQRDNGDISLKQFMNEYFQNRGQGRTLGVRTKKLKNPVTDERNTIPKSSKPLKKR